MEQTVVEKRQAEAVEPLACPLLCKALDVLAEGAVLLDREGRIVFANRAVRESIGASIPDLTSRYFDDPLFDVRWPDGRPVDREERPFQVALETQRPVRDVHYRMRLPSGRTLSLAVSAVPFFSNGEIAGVVISLNDLTEHQEAERRIRFQASLLDQIRSTVVATDIHGRIVYLNRFAIETCGWTESEALGRTVAEIMVPLEERPFAEHLRQIVAKEGHWEGEMLVRERTGRTYPAHLTLSEIRDEGRLIGYVGVAADVSRLRRAEEAIEAKDRAIREAYVEVVGAVTGGKLLLLTPPELSSELGSFIAGPFPVTMQGLSDLRGHLMPLFQRMHLAHAEDAILGVSEAATNAVKHAGGGECLVYRTNDCVQVAVTDVGNGIDFRTLPKATLMPGFSTKQSLGMGFTIMLDLSERVMLSTEPGHTVVVLEFDIEPSFVAAR